MECLPKEYYHAGATIYHQRHLERLFNLVEKFLMLVRWWQKNTIHQRRDSMKFGANMQWDNKIALKRMKIMPNDLLIPVIEGVKKRKSRSKSVRTSDPPSNSKRFDRKNMWWLAM